MKYIMVVFMFVICVIGVVALVSVTRDQPEFADGEAIAMVQNWLQGGQETSGTPSATPTPTPAPSPTPSDGEDGNTGTPKWDEDYLGDGKWLVSKIKLPSNYSESELTFEEWHARTRGWDLKRFDQYETDLSPEDREAFQDELRTYSARLGPVDILDQWYVFEDSKLVVEVNST